MMSFDHVRLRDARTPRASCSCVCAHEACAAPTRAAQVRRPRREMASPRSNHSVLSGRAFFGACVCCRVSTRVVQTCTVTSFILIIAGAAMPPTVRFSLLSRMPCRMRQRFAQRESRVPFNNEGNTANRPLYLQCGMSTWYPACVIGYMQTGPPAGGGRSRATSSSPFCSSVRLSSPETSRP